MYLEILIRLLSQKGKSNCMKNYSQVFKSVGIVFIIDVCRIRALCRVTNVLENHFFFLSKSYLCFLSLFFSSKRSTQIPYKKPHMRQTTRDAIKYHLDYVNEIGKTHLENRYVKNGHKNHKPNKPRILFEFSIV